MECEILLHTEQSIYDKYDLHKIWKTQCTEYIQHSVNPWTSDSVCAAILIPVYIIVCSVSI